MWVTSKLLSGSSGSTGMTHFQPRLIILPHQPCAYILKIIATIVILNWSNRMWVAIYRPSSDV